MNELTQSEDTREKLIADGELGPDHRAKTWLNPAPPDQALPRGPAPD
jgi:hypothetical protein